ncbi:hypothetical protein IFM89_028709 [Coptis chinensis]|uniref:DUF8039 domain-containing protein n=1 Tax=Coptis chinensis TaxID=261450 RepID=A0A835I292_9MAGN|nr:hypothetical protein IFM89_028709 [Coptis chinensis]
MHVLNIKSLRNLLQYVYKQTFMGTPSQNNLNLSGSDSEDDMEQTNYDRTPSTPESSNAPKETRGKAKGMSDTPNTKKKVWLTLDHLEQPCHPLAEVSRFSSECGVLVRRDVRICYDTFPTTLKHTLVDIFETLETSFGFVGRPIINTTYTKKVLGEAWRRHKSTLYKNLVKGKFPTIVKQGPAPEGVNLEDWRVFVDIYNTEKFQERINEDMSANSGSPMTITDDAVTRVVGKDSKGQCRAMGPRVNKTSMKSMEPILDQNYHLAEENSKLWKETQTNQMNFAMQLEEIRSTILSLCKLFDLFISNTFVFQLETSKIGKEVNLLGGWPLDIVATGCVKEVDPTYKFHERCLGERSYLVYIDEVHAQDATLPCPHDAWCKNLGESCPGNVIWPKSCVEFLSSTSRS